MIKGLQTQPCSSSSHSLRNFHLAVSEPSPEFPSFTVVSYVDDQPIIHYDSHTRRMHPLVPWMRKVEQDEPRFWDEESQMLQGNEKLLTNSLAILMHHFHHHNNTGLQTLQLMTSCEVWPDRQPRGGRYQYAYDGRDFIVLDKETPTWTVFAPQAETLKRKLRSLLAHPQQVKAYLERTCVDWLQKYLEYGKEILMRTESPMVRVARKRAKDGLETLVCQIYGFYPKEIELTWMKDREDRKPETLTGGVLPNSDGTYHTWLSIDVDPKDKDHYRCHVEHNSLPGPQEWRWKETVTPLDQVFPEKFTEFNLKYLMGIFVCFLASFFPLEYMTLPRSKWSLIWTILGIVSAVAVLVVIFIFPTSKWRSLKGRIVWLLVAAILLSFLIIQASFSGSDFERLQFSFVGVPLGAIALCIRAFVEHNEELFLFVCNVNFAIVFLVLYMDLLIQRRRRRKKEEEEEGKELTASLTHPK